MAATVQTQNQTDWSYNLPRLVNVEMPRSATAREIYIGLCRRWDEFESIKGEYARMNAASNFTNSTNATVTTPTAGRQAANAGTVQTQRGQKPGHRVTAATRRKLSISQRKAAERRRAAEAQQQAAGAVT